jgi:hypothetical protein
MLVRFDLKWITTDGVAVPLIAGACVWTLDGVPPPRQITLPSNTRCPFVAKANTANQTDTHASGK